MTIPFLLGLAAGIFFALWTVERAQKRHWKEAANYLGSMSSLVIARVLNGYGRAAQDLARIAEQIDPHATALIVESLKDQMDHVKDFLVQQATIRNITEEPENG